MHKRWRNLKNYARRIGVEFEWQEYPQFKETIAKGYRDNCRLMRIDKSLPYEFNNCMWVLKKPAKQVIKRKRRKPIKLPSEYSSNWWGF